LRIALAIILAFGVERSVVTKHVNAVFKDGELDEASVSAKIALTAADGKAYNTKIYGLDVILAVGYRAGSHEAMLFRRWATSILRQYLMNAKSMPQSSLRSERGAVLITPVAFVII
jgi:hypothetical protein